VEHFDRSQGLASDYVNSIGFDRKGQLWILNDRGADVRAGDTWRHFGRAEGMIANGSAGRAFCATVDGAIWIGSPRGLSRYEPPAMAEASDEPLRVRFSEVRIGNTRADPEAAEFVQATAQAFEARFSAMLLRQGPEVRYRYRIPGFQDRWQETARPETRFEYLPPGRYRLEVQARRDGQAWSKRGAALALEVRPRWYQTMIFRGIVLLLAGAILWAIEKLRRKKGEAARQTLERTVEQRTTELRESEERFRTMADNSPVMIWLCDGNRKITFFNRTRLNFTGRTMEQELADGWAGGVHPDDLQHSVECFDAAFEARRSFKLECRLRRSDGEYRSILCSGLPRFAPGGIFAGYIGSDVDVTELQIEERFQQLAENIDQVFWMFDLATEKVLYVSPAFERVWGRSSSAFCQERKSLLETVHPEDRDRVAEYMERMKSEPAEVSYRIIRPDGSVRWIHARTVQVCDPDGKPYRVAGIAEDVSADREREEELRQVQKMEAIGRLAGGVAHDFNNLLTVVVGYSRMLLDATLEGDPRRNKLEQVLGAANRASTLTRQLLAFSRRQVLQPRVVNVNHLLTGMEAMLRPIISERVKIETALDLNVSCIRIDPHQLEQVVINLAANARDAMPEGGRFRIETGMAAAAEMPVEDGAGKTGKYVLIRISDTGCGMDERTRERAFEPFFTTKGVGKGTGLGLSTVYGVVRQNGGRIHVSSQPDQGAVFDLYFPAVSESEENGDVQASRLPRTEGGRTVLLAEDEPGVRGLVKYTLEQLGYKVLEAADGYGALRVMEQYASEIHLLLTDVIMPLMNGHELAVRMRATRPETKVLYMSGYTDDVLAFHGIAQPEIDLIQKPFTPAELAEKVKLVLAARSGTF
jgi:PAS domain S-box-containing protein